MRQTASGATTDIEQQRKSSSRGAAHVAKETR